MAEVVVEDAGVAEVKKNRIFCGLLPVSFTLSLLKKYPGYLPSKIKRRGATLQLRKTSLPD